MGNEEREKMSMKLKLYSALLFVERKCVLYLGWEMMKSLSFERIFLFGCVASVIFEI